MAGCVCPQGPAGLMVASGPLGAGRGHWRPSGGVGSVRDALEIAGSVGLRATRGIRALGASGV